MKTIIHWYDLPSNTVVKLRKNSQKHIMNLLKIKFKKQKEIAKRLGMDRHQVRYYATLKSNFSVRSLKKITNLLKIKMNNLDSEIIELGRKRTRIKNPNLPFNLYSPEGVALISIVNSEGHIPKQKGTSMHIRVTEIDMLEKSIEYAKKIFGDFEVEIKKTKGKNTHEIFFPSVISDSLEIAGVSRGSKSKNNPSVPNYIISNNEMSKIYIGWSLAAEMECSGKVVKLTRNIDVSNIVPRRYIEKFNYGAIFKNKIPSSLIKKVSKRKCNLLEGENVMFRKLGINKETQFANLWKTKDDRITAAWKIVISDKNNMKKLLDIGIPHEEKIKKLETTINSYKRGDMWKIDTYRRTLKKAMKIQAIQGFFTRNDLVNYYKEHTKWADRKVDFHLNNLIKKNIIIEASPGKYRIIKFY